MAVLGPIHAWLNQVIDMTQADSEMRKIYQSCVQGKPLFADYIAHNGLLIFKGKIVLPKDAALLKQIIQEFHASKIGGHVGINKTVARIAANSFGRACEAILPNL